MLAEAESLVHSASTSFRPFRQGDHMSFKLIGAAVVAVASLVAAASSAQADSKPRKVTEVAPTAEHRSSSVYRRGPQVRGFVQRRGGYSYGASDSVNTYGDARTRYGSNSSYRDGTADRQTNNGPFDHGFFRSGSGVQTNGIPSSSSYHN
jgi:hypothetical protein